MGKRQHRQSNLHSIMYLLILRGQDYMYIGQPNLHSIMYLLILLKPNDVLDDKLNLHSIMYLLIPREFLSSAEYGNIFTFHNVSINSPESFYRQQNMEIYLHSIMYLLILWFLWFWWFWFFIYIP